MDRPFLLSEGLANRVRPLHQAILRRAIARASDGNATKPTRELSGVAKRITQAYKGHLRELRRGLRADK